VRGADDAAPYDGRGVCYLQFGHDQVATVDVVFEPGRPPHGVMQGPSPELTADKAEFGASRVRRWFGGVRPSAG
jgi:sulfide:quinone oxidoreductase